MIGFNASGRPAGWQGDSRTSCEETEKKSETGRHEGAQKGCDGKIRVTMTVLKSAYATSISKRDATLGQ